MPSAVNPSAQLHHADSAAGPGARHRKCDESEWIPV
jgi:hypothetical protein